MILKTIDIERLIHSTKTAIACITGLLLAKFIGLPADQWVVITIIVVMCAQISVGGVLQKAYFRFLGTLVGCLFAAFILVFIGKTNYAILLAIGVSSFAFSYIATKQENLIYFGTLGAATTTIIMLGQMPTLLFAFQRFMEISIGILIATLVSQFVLPIHARTHLRRSQAETLAKLRDYYAELMINRQIGHAVDHNDLNENIVKLLLKQRQLAKESAREPFGLPYDPVSFSQTLSCEREILRYVTFMYDALTQAKKAEAMFFTLPSAHNFNTTVIQSLNTYISVLESDNGTRHHIHVPSLTILKNDLLQTIDSSSQEERLYIDGFLFAAEKLTASLVKLADLYQVPILGAVA